MMQTQSFESVQGCVSVLEAFDGRVVYFLLQRVIPELHCCHGFVLSIPLSAARTLLPLLFYVVLFKIAARPTQLLMLLRLRPCVAQWWLRGRVSGIYRRLNAV